MAERSIRSILSFFRLFFRSLTEKFTAASAFLSSVFLFNDFCNFLSLLNFFFLMTFDAVIRYDGYIYIHTSKLILVGMGICTFILF